LTRRGGDVQLHRPGLSIAELTQPGQPAQRISLPRRSLKDCLAEELRRLDPDEVFGETITNLPATAIQQEPDITFTCSGEPEHHQDRQSLITV
ncbi:OpcA/G6PD domain-containing protein, partial [Pseudarthrobacter sulfonivorans]